MTNPSAPSLDLARAYKTPDLLVTLLSGGADSTTVLHIANELATEKELPLHAISFDYGQRHQKELEYAGAYCADLDIEHHVLDLSSIIPPTMLTGVGEVPHTKYEEIEGVSPMYVPYRNGLMISAAVAHTLGILQNHMNASGKGNAWLYCGIHSDDAAGFAYPDCTPEWFGSQANAIMLGTYGQVRLIAPVLWMSKANIIATGEDLGVDWENTWSCYKGGETHCGECATCQARKKAFADAGVEDPTSYLTD